MVGMKKALILLADGFEETEAISTHDIFTRTHEIETTLASVSTSLTVTTSMGLKVLANSLLKELSADDYDFLVLPGGKLGVENLKKSELAISFIEKFHESHKNLYSICAAPSILGELGYLDGKKYTCFPGFQTGKGEYVQAGHVQDGNLITGHSMAYTIEFAEAIIEYEIGTEAAKRIYHGTHGTDYQN